MEEEGTVAREKAVGVDLPNTGSHQNTAQSAWAPPRPRLPVMPPFAPVVPAGSRRRSKDRGTLLAPTSPRPSCWVQAARIAGVYSGRSFGER